MAIIGQTQNLTIPAVGTAGTTYATQINAALEAIEDVLETKITPASMNINQTLSMAQNAIENAAYVGIIDNGQPSVSGALFRDGGDLYWNNGSGSQVQITSGNSLSLTTVGAIGGNYSDAGSVAEVKYLYASNDYYFFSNASTNVVANLVAGGLTFTSETAAGYPYSIAATTFTRATGGSSYTATWPNAAPAGKRIVQIDNTGAVTYENDIDGGLTINDSGLTVTLGGLTVTAGGLTVTAGGQTITAGNLTLSSGAVSASGEVSGSQLRHTGTDYEFWGVLQAYGGEGDGSFNSAGASYKYIGNVADSNELVFDLPVRHDEVITGIGVFIENAEATTRTITWDINSTTYTGGTFAQATVDNNTFSAVGSAKSLYSLSLAGSIGPVNATSTPVIYRLKMTSAGTLQACFGIRVAKTRA